MERRLNCWEFKNCGRERGGLMVPVLGECPVSTARAFDGNNGGIAGGRSCWMVRESSRLMRLQVCSGNSCHACEFYRRVRHEEHPAVKQELSATVA
jgi:hypothetical protein